MDVPRSLAADVAVDAPPAPAWSRPSVMLPAFAVFAMVGALFPEFSTAATVMVLISGGALFWLGLSTAVPRRPAPGRLGSGALWWVVPAGAVLVVEAVNFGLGSTYEHPTLSKLTDPMLERYTVKAAFYFGWLASFWGLVRR